MWCLLKLWANKLVAKLCFVKQIRWRTKQPHFIQYKPSGSISIVQRNPKKFGSTLAVQNCGWHELTFAFALDAGSASVPLPRLAARRSLGRAVPALAPAAGSRAVPTPWTLLTCHVISPHPKLLTTVKRSCLQTRSSSRDSRALGRPLVLLPSLWHLTRGERKWGSIVFNKFF